MLRFWLALFIALLLSACGGGGGGGDGGGGGPSPVPPAGSSPAVVFSPAKASVSFAAGTSASVAVTASLTRPADFTNATKVYVYIVDTKGVILPNVQIVQSGATAYTATFFTSPTLAAGSYQGNLTLQLCRDSACASQFPGAPVLLPYEFTVTPAALARASASSNIPLVASAHAGEAAGLQASIMVRAEGRTWTANSTVPWLALSKAAGNGNDSFGVTYNPASLKEGQYAGAVNIVTSDGQTISVPASLTILPASFQIDSAGVRFSAVNGAPIASQTVNFSFTNKASIAWNASSDMPWLTVSPNSGTTPASTTLAINSAAAKLVSGNYAGNLTLSSATGDSKTVPVSLQLLKPTLSLSASSLTLGGIYGRDFSNVSLTMNLNTQSNTWPWTLDTPPLWVKASATTGAVGQAGSTTTFAANLAAAPIGTSTVVVNAGVKVNGDTLTAPLSLTINKDQHKILPSENGVALSSTPSWSRLSRSLTVTDNYAQNTNWTASSDQSWLNVTSGGNTVGSGATLILSANPAVLPNDTVSYATVTLASSDPSVIAPEPVKVALWKGSTTPSATAKIAQSYFNLVADPIRPLAYANGGADSIDVYNVYTGQKIATLSSVGSKLGDMAVSSNGSRLYTLDSANNKVVVFDLGSLSKVTDWPQANLSNATRLLSIRPNGVEIVLLGDGTTYAAVSGKRLSSVNTGYFSASSMAASADGKRVYLQDGGISPSGLASYSFDYSEMYGGTLLAANVGQTSGGSNGRDVAVSGDGSRLYAANGAPYRCSSFRASDLTFLSYLPGGDAYPNSVKVASDGRTYCGIDGAGGPDVWVHRADGSLQSSFSVGGGLLPRELAVSGDGLMAVALSSGTNIVFVPVGP